MVTLVRQRLLAHLARQQRLARRALAGGDLPLARALGLLPERPGWDALPAVAATPRAPRFVAPLRPPAPVRPRSALPVPEAPWDAAPDEPVAASSSAAFEPPADALPDEPAAAMPDASPPPASLPVAPVGTEPPPPSATSAAPAAGEPRPAAASGSAAIPAPMPESPATPAAPAAPAVDARQPRRRRSVVELPSAPEARAAAVASASQALPPPPATPPTGEPAPWPAEAPDGEPLRDAEPSSPATRPAVTGGLLPEQPQSDDDVASVAGPVVAVDQPSAEPVTPLPNGAEGGVSSPTPRAPATPDGPAAAEGPRELFSTPAAPVSAREWHARLERVAREELRQSAERAGQAAPAAPATAPMAGPITRPGGPTAAAPLAPATPLAPSTRRFLAPRVGIDPASAAVYQDAASAAVVHAARADAVAIGDDILLGEDVRPDTPQGRGLLAHELTHVARRRDPAFVPPVVRPPADGGEPLAPIARDEESLARQVEAAVSAEARNASSSGTAGAAAAPLAPAAAPAPASVAAAARRPAGAGPSPATPVTTTSTAPPAGSPRPGASPAPASAPRRLPLSSTGEPDVDWGELPAPWEPLPEWLAPPGVPLAAGVPARTAVGSVAPAAPPLMASVNGQPAFIQRAGEERPQAGPGAATPSESPVPAPGPPSAPAVEPDLDALAKQVYAVLRRRLAAEGRRVSGW